MSDTRPYSDYYRSVPKEEMQFSPDQATTKERFEIFVTAITQIYRCIHKIKNEGMAAFGLKGTHVMVLFQLQQHPDGLTAVQLSQACEEDKAAISRTVAELRELGLVADPQSPVRRYRIPITLTEKGREFTVQMNERIVETVMINGYGYSNEDRKTFYRVLLKIARNLQHAGEEFHEQGSLS